jgi:hypothetical protein
MLLFSGKYKDKVSRITDTIVFGVNGTPSFLVTYAVNAKQKKLIEATV